MLVPALQALGVNRVHLFPALSSATRGQEPEISPGESIHTMEIGKCSEAELFPGG